MRSSWLLLMLGWIASAFAHDGLPSPTNAISIRAAPSDRFAGVPPPPPASCHNRKQRWQRVLGDMTAYIKELRTRIDNAKDFIAYADRHNIHNDNIHLLRTYIRCCPTSKDHREKHVPWRKDTTKLEFHLPWRKAPPPVLELRSVEIESLEPRNLEVGNLEEREYEDLRGRAAAGPLSTCERDVGRLRAEILRLLKKIPALEYAAEEAYAHYHQDIRPPPNGTDKHMARDQVAALMKIHGRVAQALWRCCPMVVGMGPMPGGLKPFPSVPSQPPWPQPMEWHNYTEPVPEEVDPFDGRPPASN